MIVVFICTLSLFALIGVSSSRAKGKSTKDYLLANQNVKPWLVGLSAVATNNSGYMFIGMIGYTYTVGLASIWLMIGWIVGDFIASLFVHGKLRSYCEKYELYSFGSILANNNGKSNALLQKLVGIISLAFLVAYAAAQFSAGGKALFAVLSIDQSIGITAGAFLVVLYCFSGGIRASIWTDAAQSIVMIIAMFILVLYAVDAGGGINHSISQLKSVSANYLTLNHLNSSKGILLFIVGWLFAGFGVVGQPHIMVRYMSLDDGKNIGKVRSYYYSWFTAFYLMAIFVGLFSRILLSNEGVFDPELALPLMANNLLPGPLVGIILAGIFAATISTADSLIISCTATLSNDIFPKFKHHYNVNKLFTIGVAFAATGFALSNNSAVFDIVVYAWAILGTSFGPLLSVKLLDKSIPPAISIAMILSGGVTTFLWNQFGLNEWIYEMTSGIVVPYCVFLGWSFMKSETKIESHS